MWKYFNISSLLIWSCFDSHVTGDRGVFGASQTVLARAGDDVVLPCLVEPPFDAAQMSADWTRADLEEEPPRYVNALRDGRVVTRSVNPAYRRRTSLFRDQLSRGNVSLRLSAVRLSDEGTFRCSVRGGPPGGNNGNNGSSALIRLLVGSVSQPVISSNGAAADGGVGVLSLTCDSGCWYPRPEVSWLLDGDPLLVSPRPEVSWLVDVDPLLLLLSPAADDGPSATTERPSASCYAVRTTVTVPAALTGGRAAADLTCRVHLAHINHTAETHRRLSPDDDDDASEADGAAVHAVLIPVITGVVILTAAILMSCWRNRRSTTCWRNRPSVSCWRNRPSVAAEGNRLLHI